MLFFLITASNKSKIRNFRIKMVIFQRNFLTMSTELPPNLSVNVIDFASAITYLESELDKSKSINAQPLYKTLGMQIILIALESEAELKKHTAPGPISVQVIKGSICFRTETANDLTSGQLLTLEGNVPHSVYAYERSIFLVTKSIPE